MAPEPTYPVKKLVNFTEEMAARISTFRFQNCIPSENEAIRRLAERGLLLDDIVADCIQRGRPDIASLIQELATAIDARKSL